MQQRADPDAVGILAADRELRFRQQAQIHPVLVLGGELETVLPFDRIKVQAVVAAAFELGVQLTRPVRGDTPSYRQLVDLGLIDGLVFVILLVEGARLDLVFAWHHIGGVDFVFVRMSCAPDAAQRQCQSGGCPRPPVPRYHDELFRPRKRKRRR